MFCANYNPIMIESTFNEVNEVLGNLASGVIVLNQRQELLYVNSVTERLLYKKGVELIGRSVRDVFPSMRVELLGQMEIAQSSGKQVTYQQFIAELNDLYEININPSGNGCLIFLHIISPSLPGIIQVKGRQEDLQHFIDNATVGIHLVDGTGKILYANKAELELLGYAPEEYIGKHIADFHVDEHVISDILTRLTGHQELHSYEARLKCKDGSVRHVLISSNVYWEGEQFIHTRCFTRDITARKKGEGYLVLLNNAGKALSEAQDSTEAITKIGELLVPEFADLTILEFDGKISTHSWNADSNNGNYHDFPLVQAQEFIDVLKENNAAFAACRNDKVSGENPLPQLNELLTNSISSFLFVPIRSKQKGSGCLICIWQNTTACYNDGDLKFFEELADKISVHLENIRLYEEAKEEIILRLNAEKKKDEFISIASHELKTPLTTLKAYLQLVKNAGSNRPDMIEKFVQRAEEGSNKLQLLVDSLLNLSKIEAGKLEIEIREVNLNALVDITIENFSHIHPAYRFVKTGDPVSNVPGNEDYLEQVLINYLSNAVKYSPKESTIYIHLEEDNAKVRVSVSDPGIGISPEKLERLFERFYRVEETSFKYSGLGIGLYISAEIIRRHGGQVGAQSDPGKGSTFYFTLPKNHIQPLLS